MSVLYFVLLLIAIGSTAYYINYRVVVTIKLVVLKDYLQAIENGCESEEDFKSMTRITGLYQELDKMESIAFYVSVLMVVSWTILLFIKWF